MTTVTIQFNTEADASQFLDWMCGQGEQDLWPWYEAQENDPPLFDYDFDKLTMTQR